MYILGTIIILVILFLASCFFILKFYEKQALTREDALKKVLWKRRHKLPLLIELATRNKLNFSMAELVDLRGKVSSSTYTFQEEIELERKISAAVSRLFQEVGRQAPHKDTQLLSLQEEFNMLRGSLEIALNDYNYAVGKLAGNLSRPWFKIFAFSLKNKQFKPIASV